VALGALLAGGTRAEAAEIIAKAVNTDVSAAAPKAAVWEGVPAEEISMVPQPIVAPRPETLTTDSLRVQAIHDGKRIAFRLKWKDPERSEAGRLGEFSDAAAIQFPIKSSETPPPVMMGAKGEPVHIFHWRAQYQRDKEKGKPEMKDLYPNGSVDIYPFEFPTETQAKNVPTREREKYSPGRIEGNPQSYAKNGVDEILAEGFSTSSVQEGHQSSGVGVWENGEWTLVITRPLAIEGGSTLEVGKSSVAAFAIWQGGQGEVGSRKSLTMVWTPLTVANRQEAASR
jgi:hypothetical protein